MAVLLKVVLGILASAAVTVALIAGAIHLSGLQLLWDLGLLAALFIIVYLWLKLTMRIGATHLLDGLMPRRTRTNKR